MTRTVVPPLLLAGVFLSACSAGPPPPVLEELRRVVESPAFEAGSEAAPDLGAEAERSLAVAEQAHARGDEARARHMATLGGIQARIASAISRQQIALEREERARRELMLVQEDIARYRSAREDAEAEAHRLEELGSEP